MDSQSRRLEDRIRALCAAAILTKNPEKSRSILSEMRTSIHRYTERLRARASMILGEGSEFGEERRRTTQRRSLPGSLPEDLQPSPPGRCSENSGDKAA